MIISDDIPIVVIDKTYYTLNNLKPNTIYNVKIQYITGQGESVLSDPTAFQTDEECMLKFKCINQYDSGWN